MSKKMDKLNAEWMTLVSKVMERHEERISALEGFLTGSPPKVAEPPVGMLRYMPTHGHPAHVRCYGTCAVSQWENHIKKWGDPYEESYKYRLEQQRRDQ